MRERLATAVVLIFMFVLVAVLARSFQSRIEKPTSTTHYGAPPACVVSGDVVNRDRSVDSDSLALSEERMREIIRSECGYGPPGARFTIEVEDWYGKYLGACVLHADGPHCEDGESVRFVVTGKP